jgi:hypothetical protein
VDNVEFVTMPFSYGSYVKNGTTYSFVYPNQSELLTLINDSLNPYVEEVTTKQLDLISVSSNGSLRSTTGVLADKSVGVAPSAAVSAAPADDEDDELVETTPAASKAPVASKTPDNSSQSDDSTSSQPVESEEVTVSNDPEPEPVVSEEPEQPSAETTPEPDPVPEEPEE